MPVKIKDESGQFIQRSEGAIDRVLNRMAVDIERLSKQQVPFKKGQLKASGYHKRVGRLRYEMGYNKEYAAFQEFGQDRTGKRVVRRYSYPGKKKFYLRDPINLIGGRMLEYVRQEAPLNLRLV